ncbi:MAG: Plug domain-containing protein, partial [Crocinitomicaceae bacterium]|nr:Plug domain-containing protein [Crocinitomicaceae bacterium]
MKRFILLVLMFLPIVVLGQEKFNFHSLDTNVISEVEISTYRLQGYRKNLHNTRYSQKDLSRLGVLSASDLLQTLSSAHVNSYGPSGLASPSIRGTGANHTQVYWNGLPINSITLGQSDLTVITTELSDNVSISYGSDLSNTSGALGGTIELNQAVSWKSSSILYRQSIGSFGTTGTTVRID